LKIAFILGQFPVLSETFILNQITGLIDLGHYVEIFAEVPCEEGKQHPAIATYQLATKTHYEPQVPANKLVRLFNLFNVLPKISAKKIISAFRTLNYSRYERESLSLRFFYGAIPFLGSNNYDAFVCHFGPNGNKAVRLRDIGAISGKIVTIFHGYDMTAIPKSCGDNVYERLFATGDLFLPISEHWRNRLIQMGCDPDKIIVHRMGVDLESLTFIPRVISGGSPIRIITVARLVEKKGVEYGIRAVAALVEKFPQITYEIAGDGPLRESLQALIEELGINNKIRLIGWRSNDEIKRLLRCAHILLAPSVTAENGDQEGIPVALMEAMAMGLPVISTFHSGIPELIDDGVSGYLVPERDVDTLALKIFTLIEYPDESTRMARAGRDKIKTKFDINTLNLKFEDILKKLVA